MNWEYVPEAPYSLAVSQILGNPLDHSLYLALSWLVVRIHWAGFGVRVMYEQVSALTAPSTA